MGHVRADGADLRRELDDDVRSGVRIETGDFGFNREVVVPAAGDDDLVVLDRTFPQQAADSPPDEANAAGDENAFGMKRSHDALAV